MTSTEHVLRLLKTEVRNTPESLIRALMLVYLVDWKASIDIGQAISDSKWKKASWGPYSSEVLTALPNLKASPANNYLAYREPFLQLESINIIADVRSKYLEAKIDELTFLVFSTYPMVYPSHEDYLDLPELAAVYRRDFHKARIRAAG